MWKQIQTEYVHGLCAHIHKSLCAVWIYTQITVDVGNTHTWWFKVTLIIGKTWIPILGEKGPPSVWSQFFICGWDIIHGCCINIFSNIGIEDGLQIVKKKKMFQCTFSYSFVFNNPSLFVVIFSCSLLYERRILITSEKLSRVSFKWFIHLSKTDLCHTFLILQLYFIPVLLHLPLSTVYSVGLSDIF